MMQVPAILGPIITCLEQLDRIYKEDEGIHKMIDQCFGGLHKVKKDILYDFFKCAFDGSGMCATCAVAPLVSSLLTSMVLH